MELSDNEKTLANYLSEFPMNHSVPVYFGNPLSVDSDINNGTATLLKRNNRLYAITNHHVINGYLSRCEKEDGISLMIGGYYVKNILEHIAFNNKEFDICVLEFTGQKEDDFRMQGNVPTKFYELGKTEKTVKKGAVVAFGGYPGVFRVRKSTNQVEFHTLSSGASVVKEISDRNIIVSINHEKSAITTLTDVEPPSNIGGMSGGPVFEISKEGSITMFRFCGIIAECNDNYKVMFAKPVSLFASVIR